VNGAFRAFLVHYDADDLDVIRRPELLEHLFAVGHLRHGLWRDEAHGVDMFETGPDERAQVLDLNSGRNLPLEALPGVAGTFDELYGIVWHVQMQLLAVGCSKPLPVFEPLASASLI